MSEKTNQSQSRQDFESRLIAKAWQDEKFKQELLNNPKAIFERELGQKSPEDFQITVVEETPKHLYMVLPPKPVISDSEELSEDALEAVAGGAGHFVGKGWIVYWD